MFKSKEKETFPGGHRYKALSPTMMGLGAILYLYGDDLMMLRDIEFSQRSAWALVAAIGLVAMRDLAYMARVKILSMGQFDWRCSLRVVLLWEFASAITPSVIGGSPIAIFIMQREGMTLGRSVATVLATSFMDELFYVFVVPIFVFAVGTEVFIPEGLSETAQLSIQSIFWTGYSIHCVLTLLILFVLFLRPKRTREIFLMLFRMRWLRRWKLWAETLTNEWMRASESLKGATKMIWLKTLGVTFVSWTSRFLILNAVLYIFFDSVLNLEVFARQLSLWIAMIVSPTPGASGIAEFSLPIFMQGVAVVGGVSVLVWRILTYFIYLIIGSILLPRWMVKINPKSS